MHAWICETPTGVDALRWQERPDLQPGPGQVRVAIRAASLNFPDLLIVQGRYQMKPPPPFIPGVEYAGEVDAVGEGVQRLKPGARVAVFGELGGFATQALAHERQALPLPPQMPFDEASAFICTYATTHHALVNRAALAAGETLLVLGAAGGVGTAAVQVGRALGARVIAVASTPEKREACLRIGANEALAPDDTLCERIKVLTGGRGVDVVYDPVGGPLAEPCLRSLAWRGRYLVIGFAQGEIPSLPMNLALLKEANLLGVFWGEFAKREPQRALAGLTELLGWYTEGRIRPVIDQRMPLERLPDAFARLSSRAVVGKLVLTR